MINYEQAKEAFEEYLQGYDKEDPKIKLKWIHTYGVVDCATRIAENEKMSEEDIELAKVIALLHDIGRFEQIKRYQSFNDDNIDHASLAIKCLFDEGHIRDFGIEKEYDALIKEAIALHSLYKVPDIRQLQIKKHVLLIRDADKLDNFRVKNQEDIEVLLDQSIEEVSKQKLTTYIYDQVMCGRLIEKHQRKTAIDIWVSYLAFIFDLNYASSFQYLLETDYLRKNIDRIDYQDKATKRKMALIKDHCHKYIRYKSVRGSR